jgi:hypothetical protein
VGKIFRSIALPIIRALIAAGLAWAVGQGLIEMSADELDALTTRVAEVLVNIIGGTLATFAIFDKGLKPLSRKLFGEVASGDVAPSTHDTEVIKAEADRAKPVAAVAESERHEWKDGDPDEGEV